MESESKK
jgi:glutathione synthase/RimK-type ligase-like ATP-grasp enzyme